jgi:hypothetical protein
VQKMPGRSPRERIWIDSEIPLGRYFACAGGALLMLLFAADALTPRPPATERRDSGVTLSRIRIHSERKGPEAVLIDTNLPLIAPADKAQADLAPMPQTLAPPDVRIRQSFAQLVPPSLKQAGEAEPKQEDRKLQPKRKVTRAHLRHQPNPVAQPQHFGLFETRW